jgi:hypothetical protein
VSNPRFWYTLAVLFAGGAGFGVSLELLPHPWSNGIAFAIALTAGRLMEWLWPIIGTHSSKKVIGL